jgi:hypothetical protein
MLMLRLSERPAKFSLYSMAQHALESRPPVAVVAGKIGSSEKRLALGGQHRGQGPPVLATNGGDCGLVARIHIRTLVAVDLDRDKVFVDDRGQPGIFVALAVHHVTPVAPHGADIQQDGFVFSGCAGKGFRAPFMPLDRLVHGGSEIRRGGFGEGVGRLCHLSQVYLGSTIPDQHARGTRRAVA